MRRFFRKIGYYLWSIVELLFSVKNWGTLFSIFLGKPFSGLRWLKLRRNNISIAVTSKMEAWSVKESLIDRFYTRYSEPFGADWVIVDIGSSIGEFTVEAATQVPEGKVYVFEPNPGSINILRQNLRANNIKNVEAHNVGVWKVTGEITLEIKNDDPIHARSTDDSIESDKDVKRTAIQVISLTDMFETITKENVDLMKLDCEGTGHQILLSQPVETFVRIKRIIMEVHENRPGQTVGQLVEYLGSVGYQTKIFENWVHDYLKYLYAWREDETI